MGSNPIVSVDLNRVMLIHKKPITPGQRHWVQRKVEEQGGEKWVPDGLSMTKQKSGGRNHYGRVTNRGIGGGVQRKVRRRNNISKYTGVVEVVGIQYDPNRSGRIARRKKTYYLNKYKGNRDQTKETVYPIRNDTEYLYDLAVKGLKVGAMVTYGKVSNSSKPDNSQRRGSYMNRIDMEVGTRLCNLEMVPGKGGQRARAAGQYGEIRRKDEDLNLVWVRMKNGKTFLCQGNCTARVGSVSAEEHKYIQRGKAGRNRRRGKRPIVRGEAMNPVDHPHGGRTRGGKAEMTPWGRLAKGKPTVSIRVKESKASKPLQASKQGAWKVRKK